MAIENTKICLSLILAELLSNHVIKLSILFNQKLMKTILLKLNQTNILIMF